jgi:hypothetical protein
MKDDLSTLDERQHDVPEIPSHAHPEWIMSRDGRRLVDRPRNFREWVRQEIVYFRRRRARRHRNPT